MPSIAPLKHTKFRLSMILSLGALTSYFFWCFKFFKNNGYIITYEIIPDRAPFTKELVEGPFYSKVSYKVILIPMPIPS